MSALDGLDPVQREAASALRGPVAIVAGAGTGKTRVITRRIAHGVETGAYTPQRTLALTFTAKAAGEMRARLRALGADGVQARTFHAAALSQLRYFWPQITGERAPLLVDSKVRILAQVADEADLRLTTAALRDVASHIERRKVTMQSVETYAHTAHVDDGQLSAERLAELMTRYEQAKDARRQIDFEDVLLACAGMLEAEPAVTAQVRAQYRVFTVDEYQDLSALQHHLVRLWLGERRDLCVVGDPNQTIYSFAGAEARFLLAFDREFADAQTFHLARNYRSVGPVLDLANAIIRDAPGGVRLVAPEVEPIAPGGRGTTVTERGLPSVTAYRDDHAEAEAVAANIARDLAQTPASQIAVLYRSHAQSVEITEALARRGIPTMMLGGTRYFDIPEVARAVLALRGAAIAGAEGPLSAQVRDVLRSLGHADAPPQHGGAVRDAWEAVAVLQRMAAEAGDSMPLLAFTDELQRRQRDQHEPVVDAVTLSTLHAAKGLEWQNVYLIGVAEGVLPLAHATADAELAEERRLLYVGVTRATRSIALSWARGNGARRDSRTPSRFLRGLGTGTLREGDGDADERPARA